MINSEIAQIKINQGSNLEDNIACQGFLIGKIFSPSK